MSKLDYTDFPDREWFYNSRPGRLLVSYRVEVLWRVDRADDTGGKDRSKMIQSHTWRIVGRYGLILADDQQIKEVGELLLDFVQEQDKPLCIGARYVAVYHAYDDAGNAIRDSYGNLHCPLFKGTRYFKSASPIEPLLVTPAHAGVSV